ncbi:ABC transporter permease [Nakamurella endophytica]|uniref:ABC transporter membrane protein n=1 Tax=Nakamurella endophytica TaxID=1748367 RepID=A0A917WB30_9ACTN|nr:ABC transporter permease subunit [Nakamurella endophytica]GGL89081.1 ABC transporter membrane protein [Nakamurella endophytica]
MSGTRATVPVRPGPGRAAPSRRPDRPTAGPRARAVVPPALAALAAVVALLPLVPLLVWAFAGQWRYPALWPQRLSLRGVRQLVDPANRILPALALSVGIGVTVAVLACLLGFPAGRAVGLHRFRGRRAVQFLLLAPVLVPGLAVTLGLQVFAIRVGLADTVAGVVLVQLVPTVPYAATLLGAGFANVDREYEAQARALGARPWQVLSRVTVPLVWPALRAALLFTFLISWSDFILTLLIGGGQVQTLPLMLFAAVGSADSTVAAALALLVVAPPLVLVALNARVLTGGNGAAVGLGHW